MQSCISRLSPLDISRAQRKQRDGPATDMEEKDYRSLAGTLMYMGNAFLPQAALITSLMQQKLGRLTVEHLTAVNYMLREQLSLRAEIRY